MIDIKKIQDQAATELRKEREEKAIKQVKGKLAQIENAKQIVSNLERELKDLYEQIGQGN
jgi:DNA anti-recombination protein RmuC